MVANGFLFASGQIPIDPATQQLVLGTVEEQTVGSDPAGKPGLFGLLPSNPQTLVLKNLRAVLNAAGTDFDKAGVVEFADGSLWLNSVPFFCQVVKTTIFLKDMNDFAVVNKIYGDVRRPFSGRISYGKDTQCRSSSPQTFGASRPARATVQVARLPKDVSVEIDCVALV